nr:gas vesicle protein [uncultured Actinoplanes sp.]
MGEGDHTESNNKPLGAGHIGQIARVALAQFAELVGQSPNAVTGVRPDGDGWSLLVDVVELERVPDTTSVLATYRVDTDRDGNLTSYERLRRFTRNSTERS